MNPDQLRKLNNNAKAGISSSPVWGNMATAKPGISFGPCLS